MNEIKIYDQINALFSPEDIEMLEKFEEIKTKVEVLTKERNKALISMMEQYLAETGENTFKNGRIRITYKRGSTRMILDKDALKEQGLYDQFLKESQVAPSVSVGINYE